MDWKRASPPPAGGRMSTPTTEKSGNWGSRRIPRLPAMPVIKTDGPTSGIRSGLFLARRRTRVAGRRLRTLRGNAGSGRLARASEVSLVQLRLHGIDHRLHLLSKGLLLQHIVNFALGLVQWHLLLGNQFVDVVT